MRRDGRFDRPVATQASLPRADQKVDDEEKRVLARIFMEAEKGRLTADVARRIAEARRLHGIPA